VSRGRKIQGLPKAVHPFKRFLPADGRNAQYDTLVTRRFVATLPANIGYKFVVSGDVTGNFGGSYGGVLQALPAPEPETHTMLLAGLCLMGAILRRCKIAA